DMKILSMVGRWIVPRTRRASFVSLRRSCCTAGSWFDGLRCSARRRPIRCGAERYRDPPRPRRAARESRRFANLFRIAERLARGVAHGSVSRPHADLRTALPDAALLHAKLV